MRNAGNSLHSNWNQFFYVATCYVNVLPNEIHLFSSPGSQYSLVLCNVIKKLSHSHCHQSLSFTLSNKVITVSGRQFIVFEFVFQVNNSFTCIMYRDFYLWPYDVVTLLQTVSCNCCPLSTRMNQKIIALSKAFYSFSCKTDVGP